MNSVDLDSVRRVLGRVKFKGKTYTLMEPTHGQINQYEAMRKDVAEKMEKASDDDERARHFMEFLFHEVKTFIPEMDDDAIEQMTDTQRAKMMEFFFPQRVEEEEEAPQKKTRKRKKKAK